jgi:quercetin dioxygenase-like cupin family protein
MKTNYGFGMVAATAGLLFCITIANRPLAGQEKGQRSSRTAFTHALPALNGKNLTADIVEVTYGPGAASPAHSHPCPVIGYVLEGSVRTQVGGQAETVYTAGQSFYEAPNGAHLVSANASSTKPAKLIAFFVCDHNAPLSAPLSGEPR